MAEQLVKLFSTEIQKNLFPANEFYKQSKLDGGIDPKAKTVEIPQSGTPPETVDNPTTFPLEIEEQTDDTLTYVVDLIATKPTHLQDVNMLVINYDKRADILENHIMQLNTRYANKIARAWVNGLPTERILKTTGAERASKFGGAVKAKLSYDDILELATKMDDEDIPDEGRFLLITPDMYKDLLQITEFISFDFVNNKPTATGALGTILGFTVYKRSVSVKYTATFALKGDTATTATTDRLAVIAWHKSFVRRAEGKVKVYASVNRPEYLGDIFNASLRCGGTRGRTDDKGVFVMVQGDVA